MEKSFEYLTVPELLEIDRVKISTRKTEELDLNPHIIDMTECGKCFSCTVLLYILCTGQEIVVYRKEDKHDLQKNCCA